MRARGNLLDERLRRRVIPFKPTRVVEHQVYPGRPAISARADQRAIVSRRSKAYLKQRIRQMLLLVHRFIQPDKVVASLKRLHIRHRKLEFLMKVIDGAVESLITFHHQIGAAFQTVRNRRQRRQQSRVSHKVSEPRRQQRVKRDRDELTHWTKKRLRFRSAVPGTDLALPRKRKEVQAEMLVLGEEAIEITYNIRKVGDLKLLLDVESRPRLNGHFRNHTRGANSANYGFEKIVLWSNRVHVAFAIDHFERMNEVTDKTPIPAGAVDVGRKYSGNALRVMRGQRLKRPTTFFQ